MHFMWWQAALVAAFVTPAFRQERGAASILPRLIVFPGFSICPASAVNRI
jgi:hypothetical protein